MKSRDRMWFYLAKIKEAKSILSDVKVEESKIEKVDQQPTNVARQIGKVPRGIRGEKSSKDMASSRNLVSTIGAQASPTMVGRNQVSGRVSVPCWHATPVANDPWKPIIIAGGQVRCQGHEIGGKSDWLGSHCWSRVRMSFNIREGDTSYC